MLSRASSSLVVASLVLAACGEPHGSVTPPTDVSVAPPSSDEPVGSSTSSAGSTADLEVHEWGLIDVASSGNATLRAYPAPPRMVNVKKPVVYFHYAGRGELPVEVHVTTRGQGFVETFPPGRVSPDGTDLLWRGLRIHAGRCATKELPSIACASTDGVCEASEMPAYLSDDASCIEDIGPDGARQFGSLLYRANVSPPELPIGARMDGGKLTMTRLGADDFAGPILYLHPHGAAAEATMLDAPKKDAPLTVEPHPMADVTAASKALDAAMQQTGLSPGEIAAFDRAWSGELFGASAAKKSPKSLSVDPDVVVFAMPASMIDSASTLEITPKPKAIKRFLLVRLSL